MSSGGKSGQKNEVDGSSENNETNEIATPCGVDVSTNEIKNGPAINNGGSNEQTKHTGNTIDDKKPENSNRFSESKNFIQSIADVSLMMANISQLRAVLGLGDTNQFYIHLLTLIMISLVSHILFVFFTVIRSHFKNKHDIILKRSDRGEVEKELKEKNEKKIRYCCCCSKTYRSTEVIEGELCQCPNCIINIYLNYICSILVLITICANIGITGIGISGDC
ncbi:unnamed protein product [Mytilus coruscus]|uniref:Uncharacterized protein n=1 Tax=Mytilus coruscus TaxID=42192 RepID=A0A6J8CDE4_MYTCO|nr:unnamed protein product [Mytilus coruscus]